MKILMLAWRDMKHPKMGGAEIVTDIYLRGLQKLGHKVTLFTARYENSKEEEIYNNYRIIRKGKGIAAHFKGLFYAKKHEKNFDIILDQVNTIPFFTPLLIKREKRVALFYQLCLNVWFWETRFPFSFIGNILERYYLKLYRNTKCITISNSTKQDLIKYCWNKKSNILVLEPQISFKPKSRISNKENYFVYVGRLTKSKRVHDCIKALYFLSKIDNSNNNVNNSNANININSQLSYNSASNKAHNINSKINNNTDIVSSNLSVNSQLSYDNSASNKAHSQANHQKQELSNKGININSNNNKLNPSNTKLYIIGNGDKNYKDYLKNLTKKLKLDNKVIFTGSILEKERNKLMQKAIAILVTSVREGWGMIVTEANANGTIAITYNVEGLRDANSNKTGFITKSKKYNNPGQLAKLMSFAIDNPNIIKKKSEDALDFARGHSDWNKKIGELEEWMRK